MSYKATETVLKKRASIGVVVLAIVALCLYLVFAPVSSAYALEGSGASEQECQAVEGTEGAITGSDSSTGYQAFDSQDIIDAQTSEQGITIPDSDIPLANSATIGQNSGVGSGEGSIFNTVLVVVCVLSMLAMLVLLSIRKTRNYRVIALRTVAVTFGLVTITSWSLMDRLQTPTAAFNEASAFLAALFMIYVVLAVYSYIYEMRVNKQEALTAQGKEQ